MTFPQEPRGEREQAGEAAVRGESRVAGTGENWAGRVDQDEHRDDDEAAGAACIRVGGVMAGDVMAVKSGWDTDVTMPPYMREEAKGWLLGVHK